MAPKASVTPEEDVKFLLTIIKQLAGTINWQTVADELDLPTKGAAAKRYSRLPGKYNITMPQTTSNVSAGTGSVPSTPKKGKAGSAPKKATSSAKKRKLDETQEVEEAEDDGEGVKEESED